MKDEIDELCEENLYDRSFEDLTVEKYKSLIRSDSDQQMIRKILDDYEFAKYCTSRVPSTIKTDEMHRLMNLIRGGRGEAAIKNFLNFLFKKEMMKLSMKRRRHKLAEPHRQMIASQKEYPVGTIFDPETFEPVYRKWHNSLFMRLKDTDLAAPRNWEKCISSKFGQDLVVDLSFDSYMDDREQSLTMDQLSFLYGANSEAFEPFNLYFCNYNPTPDFDRRLKLKFPNLYRPDSFIQVDSRSYLDIFPKEKLVYLTPDAPKPLREFDNDILIIGGLVDKTFIKPLTKAKAKMEGLRMARLPIEENVMWGQGSKNLTLNQVVQILCNFRKERDWRRALETGVPKRKLKSSEQIILEEEVRRKKFFQRKRTFNHFLEEGHYSKSI